MFTIYSILPSPRQSYDLTKILVDRKTDARGMQEYGENFFSSLGFLLLPLPQTFWERSLFTKPAGPRSCLPRQRLGRR